jgi:eukaryotic-like serine/threonine-protein kinase
LYDKYAIVGSNRKPSGLRGLERESIHVNETPKLNDRYLDQPYEVSGRLIDPIGGTAAYADQRHPLKRKELEVLACLADAKDAMVTRETFIALVWRGNALTGEAGLSNIVYSLRRALQDTNSEQPLIRTIPRRGYQLMAQARTIDSKATTTFSPGSPIAGKPDWHLSHKLSSSPVTETWLAEQDGSQAKRVFRFCRNEQHLRLLQRETKVMRYLYSALAGRKDTAVVIDWQLEEPAYYLEMDYASHGSLLEWATSLGGLDCIVPAERMRLIGEVSTALAAVHAAGVVHRNLSATSVLIHKDEGDTVEGNDRRVHVRLSEFGLSDVIDRSRFDASNITRAGLTLIGDEGIAEQLYVAPECLAGQPATAASDVHALGVLLLQMAVGDLQRAPVGDWARDVASVPLRELIAACTDAQPERRPSAATVSERLGSIDLHAGASRPGEKTTATLAAPITSEAITSEAITSEAITSEAVAPDATTLTTTAANPSGSMIGQTIGPYRILDQLGEGGMGMVYLAEQHQPVQRKVALKVVRTGMETRQVLARFDAERQALALMNHPNVATAYDAGSTPNGLPYFAMEHVLGLDITAHCDQRNMDVRERIVLFLQACEGVLHAHQKGVIHRDLKPGNMLVSRSQDQPDTVKIIDFGVAKSLTGELSAHPAHTRLGNFVGTPTYSSPEQVSGPVVNVDTRTDIYSLGVVLYQLLTGVTPYSEEDLNRKSPVELARLLSHERPPTPLARFSNLSAEEETQIAKHRSISPERMKVLLGTDVSWIVGKCLEADPGDRYPSVLELEKDLRRWLEDKPIEARPTSRLYRMRKFVRRHRAGVAATTLAALTLLTATGVAIDGYARAEKARKEAESAADFQVKQMDLIDPGAMGVTLRENLILAVEKRGTERGWEPAAIAQGQQQLSTLLEGVNFTDLSLEQLDRHQFQPALASISKDFTDQPLLQARLWQSLANNQRFLGRLEAATEPQRLALEQRRRLLGEDDPLTLVSLHSSGALAQRKGHYKEAEVDFRAATTGMQRALGKNHPDTLASQGKLGEVLYEQGRYEEALKTGQELLDRSRQALGTDGTTSFRAQTLMGMTLMELNRFPEAEAFLRNAQEGYRQVYGSEDRKNWNAMNNLATVLLVTGQYAEAETMLSQVVAGNRARLGKDHTNTLRSEIRLSELWAEQGRSAESEAMMRQLLQRMKRTFGEDYPMALSLSLHLAEVLREQGKIEGAIALDRHALSIVLRTNSRDDPAAHKYMTSLATSLRMKGEFDEASTLIRDVLQAQRRTLGDTHRGTLKTMSSLASVSEARGDLQGAETLLREALAGQRKTSSDDDSDALATIDQLAQVLRVRGQLDEAAALGQKAIEIASNQRYAGQHPISRYQIHHARTLLDLRRYDDTERLLDKAKAALSQDPYPKKASVEELFQGYLALYAQRHQAQPDQGFDAKAEPWRTKLDAMKQDPTRPAAEILSGKQASE